MKNKIHFNKENLTLNVPYDLKTFNPETKKVISIEEFLIKEVYKSYLIVNMLDQDEKGNYKPNKEVRRIRVNDVVNGKITIKKLLVETL